MRKVKILFSILSITAFIFNMGNFNTYNYRVNAESGFIIDYSGIEKNPQSQFYFSDEDEFFIDGIKTYYDNIDVTSQTNFTFNTSPSTTYDGNNNDYVVPFSATYNNNTVYGQLNVKIGLRGDANCDNKVDLNDLILIENDIFQNFHVNKSALTSNDGLGIFLANVDGMQKSENSGAFGTNDLNIADAFFINSYLNNNKKSVYDNVLLGYSIKSNSGKISVSDAKCASGDTVNVYLSQISQNALGAFEISCKWDNSDLQLIDVYAIDSNTSVYSSLTNDSLKIWGFSSNKPIKDGDFIVLKFNVPSNAPINTVYNVEIDKVSYFGAGINISDKVSKSSGKIRVTSKSNSTSSASVKPIDQIEYDYGIRAWDAVVDIGTTSVKVPVMLLGGIQADTLKMTITCDNPLSIQDLSNAHLFTGSSKKGLVGLYQSDKPLNVDFETLNVNISSNAKPGKYPINITVEDISVNDDESNNITVYNGSITIKEKSLVCGDSNEDNVLNIIDAAYIAKMVAKRTPNKLPSCSDYNKDGKKDIIDAASIAKKIASRK